MNKNKIIAILSFILFLTTAYLIISSSTVLTQTLLEGNIFPAGSFITWTCLLSLQLTVYYGIPKILSSKSLFYMVINYLLIITITLAFFWGIIGFGLAGNWAYNFTSSSDGFIGSVEASFWFWRLIYLLLLVPILSATIIAIYELLRKYTLRLK